MKNAVLKVIILLILGNHVVMAQGCLDNIEDATRAYYNGRFDEVLSLVGNCDLKPLDKSSKVEVLELRIKANLLLENEAVADIGMQELLSIDPLFKPRSNDILLFRELYDSYQIVNKINFGLVVGFSAPYFEIMRHQSIASVVDEPTMYQSNMGPVLGLKGDFLILKNLFVGTGILFKQFSYSYSELLLDYQQLDVKENLNVIDIPLGLQYELPINTFAIFVNAGATMHLLAKSTLALDFRVIATDIPVPYAGIPYKTDNYNNTTQRKPVTFNYLLGGGVRKSIGEYKVELAVNFEYGINNLVNTENRYTDNTLLDTYAYVPDDFKLNHLSFSIGVYKSILSPKKK